MGQPVVIGTPPCGTRPTTGSPILLKKPLTLSLTCPPLLCVADEERRRSNELDSRGVFHNWLHPARTLQSNTRSRLCLPQPWILPWPSYCQLLLKVTLIWLSPSSPTPGLPANPLGLHKKGARPLKVMFYFPVLFSLLHIHKIVQENKTKREREVNSNKILGIGAKHFDDTENTNIQSSQAVET